MNLSEQEVLAIIPARGGSKGIVRKNVRPILGKPLLAYSIEHAARTSAVTRVVVSTDDAEIAAVAQQYGAEVIWRPAELSGDTASSESALLHVLDTLQDREQYVPDLVVFLQATSPLRANDDIQLALEKMVQENADSLFSGCAVEGFVWRSSATRLSAVNYDPVSRPRRQDLQESIIEENGSIYVFKPWVLRELKSRLGGKISVYSMPRRASYQIDVPSDLAWMAQLMSRTPASLATASVPEIDLIIFDFDGVFTNNRVVVDQNGVESVECNRGDGLGIDKLRKAEFEMLVLSTERNPVVAARCRKLKLPYVQGCDDKLTKVKQLAAERDLDPAKIVYVGNDVNDLACMGWVGVPIAVADAVPEIKQVARYHTSRIGGDGAVREVADWILRA